MDYSSLLWQAQYDYAAKSVSVSKAPESDFWYNEVTASDDPNDQEVYRQVPWLFRGVELRANAVADMPFRIMRGETEVDTSAEWQNSVGFLDNPQDLLWITEAALCMFGACYYWRERNRVRTLGVRYILPSTIEAVIDEAEGLVAFKRRVNGRIVDVEIEDLVYFWRPDPFVELGPPESSPAIAALAAGGVLHNIDEFAAAFFKRGAIKATLLTVDGNPAPQERDRLKAWWGQMISGIRNAFATELVSAAVTPVIIGEGLSELSDNKLSLDKRQDVSVAMGIPMTLLFSEAASGLGGGGVAEQDNLHFYDKTIVPQCEFIAGVLNAQLFDPLGLRFEFLPNTLDVFQQDENQRSTAFAAYVNAGMPRSLVAEMLGLELPPDWTYERLDEYAAEQAALMQEQFEQAAEDDDEEDEDEEKAIGDLRLWRRKSLKRGRLAPFKSDYIGADVMAGIRNSSDWLAAIDAAIKGHDYQWNEIDAMQRVADEYSRAAEAFAAIASNGHAITG